MSGYQLLEEQQQLEGEPDQQEPLSRKLLTSASELEPKDVSADVGKIINQPVIHGSCCWVVEARGQFKHS